MSIVIFTIELYFKLILQRNWDLLLVHFQFKNPKLSFITFTLCLFPYQRYVMIYDTDNDIAEDANDDVDIDDVDVVVVKACHIKSLLFFNVRSFEIKIPR